MLNRERLFDLYVTQRLSPDVIANIYGMSIRTLYHRLKELGISRVREVKELEEFKQWSIVELMGHVKMAGLVTEEERFGVKMGRIDIYKDEGDQYVTQFFSGSSVYRITPTTEEIARRMNKPAAPVSAWEIELPKITQREDEFANYDKDSDQEVFEDDG